MTTLELDPKDSITEALSSAPEGPVTLILKGGVWREKVTVNRPNVTLISEEGATIEADDRHGTVRDGKVFWTGDSATFTVAAPDFMAMGITFANTFDYESGLLWNEEHKESGEHMDLQAVALRTVFGASRSSFRVCTFLGHQDTLYLDAGATLFEDCTIKGNVDFIFGAGEALFQGCEIVSLGKGIVCAPSTYASSSVGFVFHDCEFQKEGVEKDGTVHLARPWHPAGSLNRNPMSLFIDCSLDSHIASNLWTEMKSKRPDGTESLWKGEDARFFISSSERENVTVEFAESLFREILAHL